MSTRRKVLAYLFQKYLDLKIPIPSQRLEITPDRTNVGHVFYCNPEDQFKVYRNGLRQRTNRDFTVIRKDNSITLNFLLEDPDDDILVDVI